MLFVYECTGNIIAEFKKFYDTQLSEQDKKKIFIPTYDCMKRYQGFLACRAETTVYRLLLHRMQEQRGTENHTEQTALLRLSGRSCHVRHNTLTSGTGRIPESTDAAGYKDNLNVNRLHQRRHNPCDTGTPSGKREIYPQN